MAGIAADVPFVETVAFGPVGGTAIPEADCSRSLIARGPEGGTGLLVLTSTEEDVAGASSFRGGAGADGCDGPGSSGQPSTC